MGWGRDPCRRHGGTIGARGGKAGRRGGCGGSPGLRPYTRGVAPQSIVEALAYINWAVLAALAIGSFTLAWLLRQATDATKGYGGFTAFAAALLGVLLFFADQSLPLPDQLHIQAAPGFDNARRVAIGLFAVLGFAASIRILQGGRAKWLGAAAIVVGIGALAVAAIGWAGDAMTGVPFLIQLLMLCCVAGGALGAVVLAHWYLVTPRISERPLILATRLLTAALVLQLVLFLTWQVFASPGGPLTGFTGSSALLVWLRLIVGLCFPVVLSYLAYRTARTRSMESAPGLLYIDLAAILASTIVAAALYFSAGLLA